MGGGVSGGTRTQLAGTYLAEQTHYQPPKYTLISVSSALGPDGCPKHLPSSATAGGAPGATPRLRQGGPAPVTVIPALADMEPLLQDNERRAQERCQENEEQAGPAEENLGVEADAPSARRYKARDREAPTEAFARLCCGHRPWVASRTDAELYAYLAQRSNDPGMAELAELAESPSPKAQETPRSVKQRTNHARRVYPQAEQCSGALCQVRQKARVHGGDGLICPNHARVSLTAYIETTSDAKNGQRHDCYLLVCPGTNPRWMRCPHVRHHPLALLLVSWS